VILLDFGGVWGVRFACVSDSLMKYVTQLCSPKLITVETTMKPPSEVISDE